MADYSIVAPNYITLQTYNGVDGSTIVDPTTPTFYANSSSLSVGNSTTSTVVKTDGITTPLILIGSDTTNVAINSTSIHLSAFSGNNYLDAFQAYFSGTVTIDSPLTLNSAFISNNTPGNIGEILTSTSGGVYWANSINIGNTTVNVALNTTSISVGSGFKTNTSGLYYSNSSAVIFTANGGTLKHVGANLTVGLYSIDHGNTGFSVNTYGISHSNGTFFTNSIALNHTGALFTANTLGLTHSNGTFFTNSIALNHTGAGFLSNSTALSHSTGLSTNGNFLVHQNINFEANNLGVFHPGVINAATLSVGSNFKANSTLLSLYTPITVDGSNGVTGNFLTSNGDTGAPRWTSLGDNQYTWSNSQTFDANVAIKYILANNELGTPGQVLTSGGSSGNLYWTTAGQANQDAQYSWTNTHTFSSNVSITYLKANSALGQSGLILTSNSSGGTYWNNSQFQFISGSSGYSGPIGQVLASNGSGGVYWRLPVYNTANIVRGFYTADGMTSTFEITGGYIPDYLDVYVNGVKLQTGIEVDISSGVTFTILVDTPPAGTVIEALGLIGAPTVDLTKYVKSFNISGNFSAPVPGVARYIPPVNTSIMTIRLTNSTNILGTDLQVRLFKNGSTVIGTYTLPVGEYTYLYDFLGIPIFNTDYLTASVIQGTGQDFSMTISN